MRPRPPRLLDASAIVALFTGDRSVQRLLDLAEQGSIQLLMPTAAIADAEQELRAGFDGWEPILLTDGVRSLPCPSTRRSISDSGPGVWRPVTQRMKHAHCGLRS